MPDEELPEPLAAPELVEPLVVPEPLVLPELLVLAVPLPELLELALGVEPFELTVMVAAVGVPKLASPVMLLSAILNVLP